MGRDDLLPAAKVSPNHPSVVKLRRQLTIAANGDTRRAERCVRNAMSGFWADPALMWGADASQLYRAVVDLADEETVDGALVDLAQAVLELLLSDRSSPAPEPTGRDGPPDPLAGVLVDDLLIAPGAPSSPAAPRQ